LQIWLLQVLTELVTAIQQLSKTLWSTNLYQLDKTAYLCNFLTSLWATT
jgi:hypothetical protein